MAAPEFKIKDEAAEMGKFESTNADQFVCYEMIPKMICNGPTCLIILDSQESRIICDYTNFCLCRKCQEFFFG